MRHDYSLMAQIWNDSDTADEAHRRYNLDIRFGAFRQTINRRVAKQFDLKELEREHAYRCRICEDTRDQTIVDHGVLCNKLKLHCSHCDYAYEQVKIITDRQIVEAARKSSSTGDFMINLNVTKARAISIMRDARKRQLIKTYWPGRIPRPRFVKAWNAARSVKEFCRDTGYCIDSARSIASRLRNEGKQLKRFK